MRLSEYNQIAGVEQPSFPADSILNVLAVCLKRDPACPKLKDLASDLYKDGYRLDHHKGLFQLVDSALCREIRDRLPLLEGQDSWDGLVDIVQKIGEMGVFDPKCHGGFARPRSNGPSPGLV